MKVKLTAQEQAIVSSNPPLQRYLRSLLYGRKATPRSWLYEQVDPDQVLANWKKHLSILENGSDFEKNVYKFDLSQEEKWGPQGEVAPISQLSSIVEAGFGNSPIPRAFGTDAWAAAKQETVTEFRRLGIKNLRPAGYQTVIDSMRSRSTLESNSGWPLFTRRNKPEAIYSSIDDAETGAWKEYPAIALFRNYNQKTRLVWMFPMSANLVEGSYFLPLQQSITKALGTSFFAPWVGFEQVRDLVTKSYAEGNFIAASDFSATDAHFRLAASLEVFDVIAPLFQAKFAHGLRESLVHMHTIPLVVGPKSKMVGDHGVSSGSNWTNFIETVFDYILSKYIGNEYGHSGLYGIGDDMSWESVFYDEDFASDLEREGKSVGQEIKADKTTNERDKVKSLQRLFQRGYSRPDGKLRAVYSTIRALKSSVYPERFHRPKDWNSDMFCARQFMILENCVDHPLFEEFVQFVCAGQRDLIPFAKKSKSELDRILRETKLLPGLNPTYNQERQDRSFAEFQSVRFARTL